MHFQCVSEGRKLRVKIVTAGYHRGANVQFPRDLRVDGARFYAPASAVSFARGPSGTVFYRVNKKVIKPFVAGAGAAGARAVAGASTDPVPAEAKDYSDVRVFEVDDTTTDCSICMCAEKCLVFVPCGHYCTCTECYEEMAKLKKQPQCPICRTVITDVVNHADITG